MWSANAKQLMDHVTSLPKPLLVVHPDDLEFFQRHVTLAGDFAVVTDSELPHDYND